MGKYKKLGKNIALLSLGNLVSKVLSFLLVPLYTAVLTTSEYGIADMITTSVNLIMPVFTLLIYESVMRYALDLASDKKQIFTIGLFITCIGCLLVIIFSPFLTLFKTAVPYIELFVLYYISISFYNLILQFAKGIEKVKIYSISGIINTFVFIFCNILFLLILKVGIGGYLLAFIIGHIISALYAFFKAKMYKYIIGFKYIKKQIMNKMLKYAIPMIPNAISWWVSNSSDKYILTYFRGVAVNGIYSVSYKIPSILTTVINIFVSAWQISAVENFGSEESKRFYADIYDKYVCLLFVGTSILVGGTKVLSKYLFANEFYEAWIYTPVLILASVYNSLASFYGSVFTSAKKTPMLFYSTLVGAVGNIALNFLLIPFIGAMGAAIATMISYIAVWIVRVVNSKKLLNFEKKIKRDVVINIVLVVEIILVCLDINPYYSVSIISTFVVAFLCKNAFLDIIKRFLKVNRKDGQNIIK